MTLLPEPLYDILYHHQSPQRSLPDDLVSVIITSYNYERFISETLDSVLNQTFRNLELVIVDDYSSDGSVSIIQQWLLLHRDRFQRLVLAKPHENQGLAQSRNTAIRFTSGKRVFVLDSDNILLPTSIARHAEVMDRTGAAVVYCAFEFFGAVKQVGLGDFWDIDRIKHGNYIDAMAMISKSAWEAVGGYSYFDVMGWEDYDLWLKFAENGLSGVFIPEVLCRYRVHHQSMTRTETNPNGLRLSIEITARHPWLDINPIAG